MSSMAGPSPIRTAYSVSAEGTVHDSRAERARSADRDALDFVKWSWSLFMKTREGILSMHVRLKSKAYPAYLRAADKLVWESHTDASDG